MLPVAKVKIWPDNLNPTVSFGSTARVQGLGLKTQGSEVRVIRDIGVRTRVAKVKMSYGFLMWATGSTAIKGVLSVHHAQHLLLETSSVPRGVAPVLQSQPPSIEMQPVINKNEALRREQT